MSAFAGKRKFLLAALVIGALALGGYAVKAEDVFSSNMLLAVTGSVSPDDMAVEPPEENKGPDVRIEVNIPATEMTVYEDEVPVFTHPIAIGSGVYPTPEQESEIKKIEWNPWWYPPPGSKWAQGAKPTPPGNGNPLGLVKMAISRAILFHGTNKEHTVGHPASHGCMRMFNKDATEVAWYLQNKFSSKTDEALRETYKKHRGTTYVVNLDVPVPVRLVYKPIVVRDGMLKLYPDYYHRVASHKKSAVMEALSVAGYSTENMDEDKIDALIKKWPTVATEVVIDTLKRTVLAEDIQENTTSKAH